MSMFGFLVLRDLPPEAEQHLDALIKAVGGEGYTPRPVPPPASAPLPGPVEGAPLNGPITWGDVTVEWSGGTPLRAWRASNPNNWATVPGDFWHAVTTNSPRERWLAWVYLAFPESSYVYNAHNPAGEDSWGALQVNRNAWPQYSVDELTTYAGNIRAAEAIYALQGFGAWWNSAHLVGLL